MGQMGDRLKRAPQTALRPASEQGADDGVEAVAIAVNRMPQRNQTTSFREEQKQDAVQHSQGVLEQYLSGESPARWSQRGNDPLQSKEDAVAERPAYLHPVPSRQRHRTIEKRDVRCERLRSRQTPHGRLGNLAFAENRQVEFEILARPCAARIDEAKAHAVAAERP